MVKRTSKKSPSKKTSAKKSPAKKSPHKSFKRTYREDYRRELEVPGIMQHVFEAFKILLKNWKIFLPFLVLVVVVNVLIVGVMNESSYIRYQENLDSGEWAGTSNMVKAGFLLVSSVISGGLTGDAGESASVLQAIIFLTVWLVTIFLLRHILAGHKIKLRDGLYNAMTPFISTLVVFLVAILQCVPIFIFLIALSAAVKTGFLATPFYALLFVGFAAVMIALSAYLLSSSLVALVAVSVPGLYPKQALSTASELMMGRRIKFIIRLVALIFAMVIMWAVVMLPLILFDLSMRQFAWTANVPFIPICMAVMSAFTMMYVTAYIYLYYRWMLDYEEK